jgi:hypothetical protein
MIWRLGKSWLDEDIHNPLSSFNWCGKKESQNIYKESQSNNTFSTVTHKKTTLAATTSEYGTKFLNKPLCG